MTSFKYLIRVARVFAIGVFTLVGISTYASPLEHLEVPAIQVNVTSSDDQPVFNAFVTVELWAEAWGLYAGNGEPLPTHLGWHDVLKFRRAVVGKQSSFVVPAFSGNDHNPRYQVYVTGLAVESCKDGDSSNYASGWMDPATGYNVQISDDCRWSSDENKNPLMNCKISLTAEQIQQMSQKWDQICTRNKNSN